jgi:TonB family protein
LPSVSAAAPASDVARLAIVGLDPARTTVVPAPPPSRSAGFSAGPKPEPNGAESDGGSSSGIVVPGVTVRDGMSRQALLAAIRPMAPPLPPASPMPGTPPATRVSGAPDPSLEGRVVYSIAIQMPNVTSYSGSWLVWFAERQGGGKSGGMVQAPSPLRKVDPKYIASAVADGVQGVVRLGAVIRKDGRLDSIKLLRHLDDRLDHSAMESLAKWQFDPAVRDGAPVDVDAVFEIPFRLAPKPTR